MNKDTYTKMVNRRNELRKMVRDLDLDFELESELSTIVYNILKETCLIKAYQDNVDEHYQHFVNFFSGAFGWFLEKSDFEFIFTTKGCEVQFSDRVKSEYLFLDDENVFIHIADILDDDHLESLVITRKGFEKIENEKQEETEKTKEMEQREKEYQEYLKLKEKFEG